MVDEQANGKEADEDRGQKVAEPNAGHQEDRPADGREHQGAANVRFAKDQSGDQPDDKARDNDAAQAGAHLAPAPFAVPGQGDQQGQFGKFRRLEAQAGEVEPAPGAPVPRADAGRQHQPRAWPPLLFRSTHQTCLLSQR